MGRSIHLTSDKIDTLLLEFSFRNLVSRVYPFLKINRLDTHDVYHLASQFLSRYFDNDEIEDIPYYPTQVKGNTTSQYLAECHETLYPCADRLGLKTKQCAIDLQESMHLWSQALGL